jgi:hypothetical protein
MAGWREIARAKEGHAVFLDQEGEPLARLSLAGTFREHLKGSSSHTARDMRTLRRHLLQHQIGHLLEVSYIQRDEREVVNETGGRDESIRESHRDASGSQVAHDLPGALGDGSVDATCVEGTQERTVRSSSPRRTPCSTSAIEIVEHASAPAPTSFIR